MSEEIIRRLDAEKIKINWNKKPIKMDKFLSFLTVKTDRSENHMGSDTGWTQHFGDDDLIISGGILTVGDWPNHKSVEYLDSIKYKKKLKTPYNDFVNPFYLFEIMTQEGKDFFVEYYKEDIESMLSEAEQKAKFHNEKLNSINSFFSEIGL